MTHRERVLCALSHKQPDRIPLDLGSSRDSSIVASGYEKLKKRFNVNAKNIITNRMMQTVEVDEKVLDALDIDTVEVMPPVPDNGKDIELPNDSYKDEWGAIRTRPKGSEYYDQTSYPLSGEITVEDIKRYKWPDPKDPGRVRGLKEKVAGLKKSGRALVLNMPSAIIHSSQYLRGYEDWFIDIGMNEKLIEALFDAVLIVNMGVCEALLKEVGNDVDVLIAADDLGLQDRLMMSEEKYRKLVKPRHKKYFALLHKLSTAKVFFHTCGAVSTIIGDFIEIGVDILNPVQVSATGMDPVKLKKNFGKDICFWGGIDTQNILPKGSPKEVEKEVERMIEALGKNGGYVLGAVHNIQPDVPVENIIAMFKHAAGYKPKY